MLLEFCGKNPRRPGSRPAGVHASVDADRSAMLFTLLCAAPAYVVAPGGRIFTPKLRGSEVFYFAHQRINDCRILRTISLSKRSYVTEQQAWSEAKYKNVFRFRKMLQVTSKTSIYLQNSALIQRRASPPTFFTKASLATLESTGFVFYGRGIHGGRAERHEGWL